MEKIDFNIAVDRRNTNSVKWSESALENFCYNPKAKAFWIADMDFMPEPHIKAKGKEIADVGIYGYPSFPNLVTSFTSWLEHKHQWNVNNESVVYTMGLLHGIGMAIDLLTKEGDKILIPSPTYKPFRELCEYSDRVMEEIPLSYKDGFFSLDRTLFKEKAKHCNLILFCSPHNPTGIVFTDSELNFVLQTAKELNIPVISDEIHADLVHPKANHIPMGKANEKVNANCITFMAPSKTFNVAGEHSAFAIFSDLEVKAKFVKRQKALWVTTPGFLIGELTETAYTHGLEYNKALCKYLEENEEFIGHYLAENCPEITLVHGNASFVALLDCSKIYEKVKTWATENPDKYKKTDNSGLLSCFFGQVAGVAMNDGTWFGERYPEFVRFNFGTSRDMVKEALDCITRAVKSL